MPFERRREVGEIEAKVGRCHFSNCHDAAEKPAACQEIGSEIFAANAGSSRSARLGRGRLDLAQPKSGHLRLQGRPREPEEACGKGLVSVGTT